MKPKNVVVLMGGISPEREISLRSGNAVARALKEAGFRRRGATTFRIKRDSIYWLRYKCQQACNG